MIESPESLARAQERIARSLHKRKPMWRRSNPWYVWALLALLFVGLWAMNLIHAATPAIPGTVSPLSVALGGLTPSIYGSPELVSWGRTTLYDDGTTIPAGILVTYNVYESIGGSAEQAIGTNLSVTAVAINEFPLGIQNCITVTAVAQGIESKHTTPLCVTPPPRSVKGDTNAYKRREGVGTYGWVIYGTIAVGTPCDSTHQDDGYQLVPRSAVTLNSRFDVHPLDEWARCQ